MTIVSRSPRSCPPLSLLSSHTSNRLSVPSRVGCGCCCDCGLGFAWWSARRLRAGLGRRTRGPKVPSDGRRTWREKGGADADGGRAAQWWAGSLAQGSPWGRGLGPWLARDAQRSVSGRVTRQSARQVALLVRQSVCPPGCCPASPRRQSNAMQRDAELLTVGGGVGWWHRRAADWH